MQILSLQLITKHYENSSLIEALLYFLEQGSTNSSQPFLILLEDKKPLRELSFLKLGTGVEELLEGYQIFWPCFIGVSNISEKIVKYLMGCEIFGVSFRPK